MPTWLDDAPGIDPSLFFDDDGHVWYVGNRHDFEGHYHGHCVIWLQELDQHTLQLIGKKTILWDGALKGAIFAEGPHLYRINGMYYLLIAEGGTGHNHAVTIARSENIMGPYEFNPRNPILTHRHLGLDYPIVGTGHGDIVETQYGEWWMVALAMRPYDGYFYNLGRETFLTPVKWEDGWPIVSPGHGHILFEYTIPNLPEHPWPTIPACDHFEDYQLAPCWNFLRTPREDFWNLTKRPGYLRLKLRPEQLTEQTNPSFIGRRQQHINFTSRTAFEFDPQAENETAGLVVMQNNRYHFRLECKSGKEGRVVQLIRCFNGNETFLGTCPVKPGRLYMKIEAEGQSYNFYVTTEAECWIPVAERVDGRILSTEVAGGFVGAYIGMYASSNGHDSDNFVDFDWFEYLPNTAD